MGVRNLISTQVRPIVVALVDDLGVAHEVTGCVEIKFRAPHAIDAKSL